MIDISGDVIYFQGKVVGIITVPNGSLRGDFEEALGYSENEALDKIDELEGILSQIADLAS